MPEGDTVWFTARRLDRGLAGHELTKTDFRVPKYALVDLSGRVVDEVVSRGKHLLAHVGDMTIHSHLKMEGIWQVGPRGERWIRPAHSARAVLETADVQAVGFWLGMLNVVPRSEEESLVGHLGPDLLGPDWDAKRAVDNLAVDPDRPAFLAFHDQRNLAGLGNEYVNELLFVSGVAPTRPTGDVDLPKVVKLAHRMITANRDRASRIFTGSDRPGQTTWVYGRERQTCRRCGTRLERGELGDDPTKLRNVFWCPSCQR